MAPSPNDNGKAKEILDMMRAVRGNIPMPVAFATEDGSPPILLDDMIQHLETVANERRCTKTEMGEVCGDLESNHHSLTHPFTHPDIACQVQTGSDDVCGLMPEDPIHSGRSNGHTYTHAGVAQSGERLPRKQEAAGSIPVSSSKPQALTADQHQLVATIVHHRVAAEDNRRAIEAAQESLKISENVYKQSKADAEKAIANASRTGQFHMEQMLLAEDQLRQSILSDVMIKGAPEPEPTPEAEFEHDDQIGRAG